MNALHLLIDDWPFVSQKQYVQNLTDKTTKTTNPVGLFCNVTDVTVIVMD